MDEDLKRDELYEKRIDVACNLLGITKDLAYELQEEMCDSVTSVVIKLAHRKNPNLGLCKYYEFSLDASKNCIKKCNANHIVDGVFDVSFSEDTKIPHSKYGWENKYISKKLMNEDELLKTMDELHYNLDKLFQ
jgi:hypothetical protein